jgi:hypothetical protein
VDSSEELVSHKQLQTLGFPVYGTANWHECGRAIYSVGRKDGGPLFALGLSHQVRVQGRIAYMGVQTFTDVQPERLGASVVDNATLTLDGVEYHVVFRSDSGPHPLTRFVHDGQTVEVEVDNWQMDQLQLVTVDPAHYYDDTLLSHWPEP